MTGALAAMASLLAVREQTVLICQPLPPRLGGTVSNLTVAGAAV